MQITSTFILAAMIALKATSVAAVPFASNDVAEFDARDIGSYYDTALEARFYDDEFELDSRDFDDEYELLAARGGRFDHKISNEKATMSAEAAKIKADEARLANQQKTIRLQEQIHHDKSVLRKDNFGNPGSTGHTGAHRESRFQSKISNERDIMAKEQQRLKAERLQLLTQGKDMRLQEQIHRDRLLLKNNNAFGRREEFDLDARDFEEYEELAARGGRFDRKIANEKATMDSEAAKIKADQARLANQEKVLKLQEQVHHDKAILRKDNFGNTGAPRITGSHRESRFQSKISSERAIMAKEQQRLKSEQLQLATQGKDMRLQEQIHRDRLALKNSNAFGRREY